ncbi:hypothetical protein BH11MYX4_BH11MYX4_28190 [soil metagenome]
MPTNTEAESLLIVGECPVAPGFGGIVVLTSVATGKVFFFAPCCGVAWNTLPRSDRIDEINTLDDIAPGAIALVTRANLATYAPGLAVVREEPLADWILDIPRLVRPGD